jgi:hypothetical protein
VIRASGSIVYGSGSVRRIESIPRGRISMIRYASVVCQRISKIAARHWLVILMSAIRGLLIRTPCGKFFGHGARRLERKALRFASDMLCGTVWIRRYRELWGCVCVPQSSRVGREKASKPRNQQDSLLTQWQSGSRRKLSNLKRSSGAWEAVQDQCLLRVFSGRRALAAHARHDPSHKLRKRVGGK